MATQKRYRLQFKFWLNENNPAEKYICDVIEWMKNDRLYAKSIRDGLRLIWDLGHGRTGVLLELYPEVREWLAVPEPPKSDPDDDDIKRQIAELRLIILEQRDLPKTKIVATPAMLDSGVGQSEPRQLAATNTLGQGVKFTAPVDDDDDDDGLVFNEQKIDITANLKKGFASIGLQL